MAEPVADTSGEQVYASEQEVREEFRRLGLGYLYEPTEHQVTLRLDYVERHKSELSGMLIVNSRMPGTPQHLHQAHFNISHSEPRRRLASALSEQTQGPGGSIVPWRDVLEAFCTAVLRAEDRGEPFIKVGRMPLVKPSADRIDRLIAEGKPNLLYGPGGAGKGYIAAMMCLCIKLGIPFLGMRVTPGNPLYLDWEDDPAILDWRIKLLAAGLGVDPPEIDYRTMKGPLRNQINAIAAKTDADSNDVIVVDSVEMAIGATSEASSYEFLAKSLFEALNQIRGVTSILVDHISDAARQNKKGVNKAYGSIMKGNWCRKAWEVKNFQKEGDPINHVGLYQYKANHSGKIKPVGIAMDFQREETDGLVLFRREDIADVPILSEALRVEDRIAALLREGAMPTTEIAELLSLDQDVVRATINRLIRANKTFVRLPNGNIGLLAENERGPVPIRPGVLPYKEDDEPPAKSSAKEDEEVEPPF
jgi:hypothetical protein